MRFDLRAILKLHSPLHIAAPGEGHFDLDSGLSTFKDTGIACTLIQRLKLAGTEDKRASDVGLPVIAANNIAGRLRRHAARLVLDALAAKSEKVSLPTYSVLMCGAATGQPAGEDITYSEYQKASAHPYLGMFGGGPKLLRRGFRAHNALPICALTSELRGALCHPAVKDHEQKLDWMVQAWAFRRNDDIRELVDAPLAERGVQNFVQSFSERQTKILEEISQKGRSTTSTRAYSALEFVVPGTAFDLLFEGEADEAQMGLFLASLDSFCATERLGGHSRNGFGVFSLNDVRLRLDGGEETTGLFNNGRLVSKEEPVRSFLTAWETAAKELSAADLEELVRLPEAKEPGEKKRGRPRKGEAAGA